MKFVKNFQQSITIASRNYSTQSKYSNRWCIVCTRYTVRELCILGCAWPRRTRGAQWRDTRVFTRATPTGQPWRPGWKSRDVRRVRDCVHACIRPFVCTGFDRELPLRGGGETRANQSPSAFGFATPYVHHPPTSPEFRWSSPGNRFISPPFHPTQQWISSFFLGFREGDPQLTSSLLSLFLYVYVFLSQGGCSGQFYSPRASKIPVSVDARSATVYKDRGFVCYRRMRPTASTISYLDDGEIRWKDGGILEGFCNDDGEIEMFIWRFERFFFNLWD